MKKFGCLLLFAVFFLVKPVAAQHLVQEEDYLAGKLNINGLPDYPPFSYYTVSQRDIHTDIIYHSVFLNALRNIEKKYSFEFVYPHTINPKDITLQSLLLNIRSGADHLFLGVYSNTKLFTGIDVVFPAAVSNPIHIITLPQTKEKIKTSKDLMALKGAISKTEYLSDFALRKIKPLTIEYVDTPYNAYEKLFTGEVDYLIGSMYYNKMMSSKYGIEPYLAYSTKPIFKIPVFIGMSKLTPKYSLYKKVFEQEFGRPEFATSVKKEILRIVEEEVQKNIGIVPPAFAQKAIISDETATVEEDSDNVTGGKIIEKEIKQKTIDEVLDGM